MANQFAHYDEWIAWAARLRTTSLYYSDEFRSLSGELSEKVVHELGQFYERVVKENEIVKVNSWLKAKKSPAIRSEDETAIRNLILLFPHIGRYWGVRPFNTNVLAGNVLISPTPDWSKLPDGAEFLSAPAECAARFPFPGSENDQNRIADEVEEQELLILKAGADQLRRMGPKNIRLWWQKLGVNEHIEAALVFKLFAVMDALGLKYCE